jgi:hypothetical protein
MEFSLGAILSRVMQEKERGDIWVGRKINKSRNTVLDMRNRQHMSTDVLMDLSRALEVDLFAYLSEELKARNGQTNFEGPKAEHFSYPQKQRFIVEVIDGKPSIKELGADEEVG